MEISEYMQRHMAKEAPEPPRLAVEDITFYTKNGAKWTEEAKRVAAHEACGTYSTWEGPAPPTKVNMLLATPIEPEFLAHDVVVQCEAGGARWELTLAGFTQAAGNAPPNT